MARRSKRSNRNRLRSTSVTISRRSVFGRKFVTITIVDRSGTRNLEFYQTGSYWVRKLEQQRPVSVTERRRFMVNTQLWSRKHSTPMHREFAGMRFEHGPWLKTKAEVNRIKYTDAEFNAILSKYQ